MRRSGAIPALVVLASSALAPAQDWPAAVREVRYPCSADGTRQPAMFYAPPGDRRVPLLVGLHTWSGGFRQGSSVVYARWCIDRGWAFIHPHFRGPNRRPAAAGSEQAVADIVDAVAYAQRSASVDPDRVYLIGASGGGHACLLLAGRHPELFAGISAWVPIADLAAWHGECKRAGRGYWRDLERACGGPPGASPAVDREYRRRSPLRWLAGAGSVALDINAGIHDGHTGSVPVRHALRAFNAVVPAAARFGPGEIEFLTTRRRRPPELPAPAADPDYGDHQPLLRRTHGQTRLTLFDGGHQGIPTAGLRWLARQVRRPRAWTRHTIDPATDRRRGADGVRLADADGDGRLDVVTGWEEGRAIRICLHPGPQRVRQPWPAVTVGTVADAEDAVFVDLDRDGNLDVVSATEGRTRTVFVHWAPRRRADYRTAAAWTTAALPVTAGRQSWMFTLPLDIDGHNGIDLLVGSKGRGAAVGWLQSPPDPRDLAAWRYHRIVDAGWIMSLRRVEPGPAVLVSDRRGPGRGVYRLTWERTAAGTVRWQRTALGGHDHEVMFLATWPDGQPLAATRNGVILDWRSGRMTTIPNPAGQPWGKAVAVGDLDGDGRPDLVHTANTGRQPGSPGVTWLRQGEAGWQVYDISGTAGSKFDRLELIDLDGDGDLDVVTCEENAGPGSRGLGVVWYENPCR